MSGRTHRPVPPELHTNTSLSRRRNGGTTSPHEAEGHLGCPSQVAGPDPGPLLMSEDSELRGDPDRQAGSAPGREPALPPGQHLVVDAVGLAHQAAELDERPAPRRRRAGAAGLAQHDRRLPPRLAGGRQGDVEELAGRHLEGVVGERRAGVAGQRPRRSPAAPSPRRPPPTGPDRPGPGGQVRAMVGTDGNHEPASSTAASRTRVCVATTTLGTSRRRAQSASAGGPSPARRSTSTTGADHRRPAKRVARAPHVQRAGSTRPQVTSRGRASAGPAASVTNGASP